MPMKEHHLGFSKIGRDLQIDLRSPSYGAHNVADFRHFRTEFSERITDKPWSLAIYPATNMFMIIISGLELCIRVDLRNAI